MDKYRRVPKVKDTEAKADNEIRVTAVGSVSAYVSFAAKVFNDMEKSEVVVKATGNALAKAVTLAEVIKRRFKGLHQITKLGLTEIKDEYEPLEEGLDKVTDTRSVPYAEITLSKKELDTKDVGYQAPVDESLVTEYDPEQMTRSRGRGRGKGRAKGRGGKGKGKGKGKGYDDDDEPKKGKGKGKGKKGKGKGKGGDEPKGKGKGKKGKGKGDDSKGGKKGKGKGKDDGYSKGGKKGKGKSKGYDDGKGKGKSKGKSSKSSYSYNSWDDWSWSGGWNDWDYSSWSSGGSKGKGKSKGKSKW